MYIRVRVLLSLGNQPPQNGNSVLQRRGSRRDSYGSGRQHSRATCRGRRFLKNRCPDSNPKARCCTVVYEILRAATERGAYRSVLTSVAAAHARPNFGEN